MVVAGALHFQVKVEPAEPGFCPFRRLWRWGILAHLAVLCQGSAPYSKSSLAGLEWNRLARVPGGRSSLHVSISSPSETPTVAQPRGTLSPGPSLPPLSLGPSLFQRSSLLPH